MINFICAEAKNNAGSIAIYVVLIVVLVIMLIIPFFTISDALVICFTIKKNILLF